jgi:palmitoyltransferase ZDHHC4
VVYIDFFWFLRFFNLRLLLRLQRRKINSTMTGPMLFIILFFYLLTCGSLLYFCVIADPHTNKIAYFVNVTLPETLWSRLGNILGPKKLDMLSQIMDLALVFVYFAVVLGCWTMVFLYVYPWISVSNQHVSEYHKYIGYVVFVACFGSWRLVNSSSPGLITQRTWAKFDHYPYDNLLFLPNQRCQSTNLIKIARSKFDRLKYNRNVPRYDHFCGWVYNTIGEENYRWFLLFLTVHVAMCFYGATITFLLFRGEVKDKKLFDLVFFDRATGEEFKADWTIVLQYLFTRRMGEAAGMAIMVVMGIALAFFLGYHIHLTNRNMTTNEAGKWQDINAWYKKEQKKYEDAVKAGLVTPPPPTTTTLDQNTVTTTTTNSTIEVSDVDVTCTPTPRVGTTTTAHEDNNHSTTPSQPATRIIDPGPVPPNLYSRGLIENWKEVIFPLSLRKEALERLKVARATKAAAKTTAAAAVSTATASSADNNTSSPKKSKPIKRVRASKPKVT